MKATSKIKSAPPNCGVGGGAYSREISSHVYAPTIYRKQKVKRDMGSQFLLASVSPDEIRLQDKQSSRIALEKGLNVPNAVGKARDKCVLKQVRRVFEPKRGRFDVLKAKGPTLTDGVAASALARIAAQKQARAVAMLEGRKARLAREAAKREQELANLRATAHLHIKSVEAKHRAKREASLRGGTTFNITAAFAGL